MLDLFREREEPMPIIEVTYSTGSLKQEQQQELVEQLTPLIAKWEGQPNNHFIVANTWVMLHEQPAGHFTVGGQVQRQAPRYRVTVTAPQGALSPEHKQGLVQEITRTLLSIEGREVDKSLTPLRVWCFIQDVADGNWGYGERILTLDELTDLIRAATA
jgi:phenylpyruvate tautomerase PptA (4-oxalocrotonate tautomerase family)